MVKFKPFKGVLYNKKKVKDFSKIISQPYDKISSDLQETYYEKSPYNAVRIIKNKAEAGDNYQTAKKYLDKWLEEKILEHDDAEAFYYLEQTYTIFNKTYTRKALIGLGKVYDYKEEKVLPHEQTLKGPKIDRLELLRTTQFNFGQVFMLYEDPDQIVNTLIKTLEEKSLHAEFTDEEGVTHSLYSIKDKAVIEQIQSFLNEKKFYIADGHHRYETALAYSKESNILGSKYRMMAIVNAYGSGLKILPTHRLVNHKLKYDFTDLIPQLEKYFRVKKVGVPKDYEGIQRLIDILPVHSLLFFCKDNKNIIYQLNLQHYPESLQNDPETLRLLDVYVLHKIIFEHILGITEKDFSKKTYISYKRNPWGTIKSVQNEEEAMCFLMKSTDVKNVLKVADEKLTMPQKSTDFYPKLLTGYVFADLNK